MLLDKSTKYLKLFTAAALIGFGSSACSDDEDDDNSNPPGTEMSSFDYAFNNGEVGAGTAYEGNHKDNFSARLEVKSDGENAEITVTLNNTVNGVTYMVHAHDAADPSTTPNGTPYNETPNGDVLATGIEGNGGTVTATVSTNGVSYDEIVNNYGGFFVIHDPLQDLSTVDLSTYLVVGSFARDQGSPANYQSQSFSYSFNTGQVDPAFAYGGNHPSDLSATLTIQELANDAARVSVVLENTQSGETYPIHAHDFADPATTPNGTPYDETPNSDVLTLMAMGNGGEVRVSQNSSLSFSELTTNYDAFLVVHDPLQAVSTIDPTTYVILGVFGRN